MYIPSFKFTTLTLVILCAYMLAPSLCQSDQKIKSVQQCNHIIKSQFVKKISAVKPDTALQDTIRNTFPADKNLMFRGIWQKKLPLIQQSVKGKQGNYVIHIGIVLLLGLFHLILLPILLFTRCCQRCCRPSPQKSYTTCKLCWPATIAIILLLILAGVSAIRTIFLISIVIYMNRQFEPKMLDMKCSLAMAADDLLEGGAYDDFAIQFIGLRKYRSMFDNFTEKLSSNNNNAISFSQNSRNLDSFNKKMKQIQKLVRNVPSSTNNRVVLQYSYPISLQSQLSGPKQQSTFPQVLGTSTQPLSLLGNLSQSISQTKQKINILSNFSNNFTSIAKSIPKQQIKSNISAQINIAQSIQFNIVNTITLFERGLWKAYSIGTYVIMGVTILFALLLFCGLIGLAGNRKYSYRRHVIFCCLVIWLVGLLHFVLAIGFSLANAVVVHGCQYLREGISTQVSFKQNFVTPFVAQFEKKDVKKLIINQSTYQDINGTLNQTIRNKSDNTPVVVVQFDNITKIIGKCLPSSKQSDYIYWNIMGRHMDNISRLNSYLPVGYNPRNYFQNLQANYTNTLEMVQKYRSAQILDIKNPQIIKQLEQMSKSQPCFPDNWVPSLNQQPQIIPCGNNRTKIADNSTCKIQSQFVARSSNCVGCIDTFRILERYNSRQDVYIALLSRYDICVQQNRQGVIENLTNIWANFYRPKNNIIGQVKQRLMLMNQPVNQTKKITINLTKPFQQAINWLQNQPLLKLPPQINKHQSQNRNIMNNSSDNNSNSSNVSLIHTPVIKKSMDCRVFGKSLSNALNYSCTEALKHIHILRILYIVAALLSFFACLLAVWTTSRFYQQNNYNKYIRQHPNVQYQQPFTDIRLNSGDS